ncbi:hypothetical protein HPP92_015213 [Vanilla planifolia]|uniref:Uncharacterized protein n=1 Tax=Vanilla planifolia TaxID=51239 RepID=A0A835QXC2_VANPL|nr:hypothetical protein HPP92_015213 [Vanilla planifolia]
MLSFSGCVVHECQSYPVYRLASGPMLYEGIGLIGGQMEEEKRMHRNEHLPVEEKAPKKVVALLLNKGRQVLLDKVVKVERLSCIEGLLTNFGLWKEAKAEPLDYFGRELTNEGKRKSVLMHFGGKPVQGPQGSQILVLFHATFLGHWLYACDMDEEMESVRLCVTWGV